MAKFVIEIRSRGFDKATQDFIRLNKESGNLNENQKRLRNNTIGLRRQLGALRNNILLLTFAYVGLNKGIGGFIRASAGFESVRARLVGLTGSTEEAKLAFDAFNKVAATTPFQLQDVVNAGAQLEAFGLDSKNTLRAVTDLAAFMGSNATEAANALGRAFAGGAGAAEILRERGILELIKSSQGIKDFSKITLPEFRAALLAAMVDPVAGIQGSSQRLADTFNGAVSNMQDALTRFQASIGDVLLPKMTELVKSTEAFFRAADPQRLFQLATAFSVAATALAVYNARAAIALSVTTAWATRTALLTASFAKLIPIAVALVAAIGIDKFLQARDAFDAFATKVDDTKDSVNSLIPPLKNVNQQTTTLISNLSLTGDQQLKLNRIMQDAVLQNAINAGMEDKRIKAMQLGFQTVNRMSASLREKVIIDNDALTVGELLVGKTQELTEAEEQELAALKKLFDLRKEAIGAGKELVTTNKNITGSLEGIVRQVKNLKNQSQEQQFGTLLRIMAQLAALTTGGGQAAGALNILSAAFGHTGGLVKNNGIQRFANGGMVQGQDNVPIMAQAGEFIIRRDAVQNIGVGNLAQMNRTGSSGANVTVNIQGGVVQEDYVRNTLIPALNKATSQGSRINA